MAQAPRPGAGKRKKEAEEAQAAYRMTIRGESRTIMVGNVTVGTKYQVQMETDRPFEWWRAQIRHGSPFALEVIWWVAGLEAGLNERWHDVRGFTEGLTPDDIEVVEDDGEDDNPEG